MYKYVLLLAASITQAYILRLEMIKRRNLIFNAWYVFILYY